MRGSGRFLLALTSVVACATNQPERDFKWSEGNDPRCRKLVRQPEVVEPATLIRPNAVGVPAPRTLDDGDWDAVAEFGCQRPEGVCGCEASDIPEEQREGRWAVFRDNGVLWIEAFYRAGRREGLWTRWSRDGEVVATRNYSSGILVGQERSLGGPCPTFVYGGNFTEPNRVCDG